MAKRIRIRNQDIDYEVVPRNVEYPRLEYKTGKLVLVLPRNYMGEERIIDAHKDWIYKKHSEILSNLSASRNKKLVQRSDQYFRKLVNSAVKRESSKIKVKVKKVFFRRMKSKWASCSAEGNLTINSLMRYLPKELIEYVVYHEITHFIERGHNERFWKLIRKRYKNPQRKEKELFIYWFKIQSVGCI
ncbi:MAG: M48 family metallopeptidase [Candidatus Altiarchaeota archaeon]|nr:M48 family metallopeptidase [Candidatus Altiarchaeota archaeon]